MFVNIFNLVILSHHYFCNIWLPEGQNEKRLQT